MRFRGGDDPSGRNMPDTRLKGEGVTQQQSLRRREGWNFGGELESARLREQGPLSEEMIDEMNERK
jgi:hypothetical protein